MMGRLLELHTTCPKIRYNYTEVVTLLPATYREKVTANEAKNRAKGAALLLWCVTQSTHFIDSTSANVLQFIIARTYGYAKEGELISINHFITGVFASKDGRSIIAPAVKDRATVYKALGVLEAIGLVERTRVTINSADVVSIICVNADAVLALTMTENEAKMLRVSKKQKQLNTLEIDEEEGDFLIKSTSARVGGFPTSRVGGKPTTEYINKEDIKNLSCSGLRNAKRITRSRRFDIDCKDTAEVAIAKAVARVTERRNAKVRGGAARGGFISLQELNATWQGAMITAYGSCTVSGLTHKEYGILKRVAKTHVLDRSWKEFCEWVIAHWAAINRESRSLADYKKKRTGEWSLKDEEKIFLGTDRPDIFQMARNFVKLIKRFSQYTLTGRTVVAEETAEVAELKRQVLETRKEAALHKQMLQKALNAKEAPVTTLKPRKSITLIDPKKDTFFDESDDELPEWR
jgi:hypothetical protein